MNFGTLFGRLVNGYVVLVLRRLGQRIDRLHQPAIGVVLRFRRPRRRVDGLGQLTDAIELVLCRLRQPIERLPGLRPGSSTTPATATWPVRHLASKLSKP